MSWFGQLFFQDASSPTNQMLIILHDHIMVFMVMIFTLVFLGMGYILRANNTVLNINKAHLLEQIWTVLPMFLLAFIAFPSLRLLYVMDEIPNPSVTLKAIGHQWYWSYEYSDQKNLAFDSYMLVSQTGSMNLLEVDNRAVLPFGVDIRLLVTSMDVIHSWAVPSLGVKIDAIPGRLNQFPIHITRPGIFYGMCSEICGAGHAFMPIVVESISPTDYSNWISSVF